MFDYFKLKVGQSKKINFILTALFSILPFFIIYLTSIQNNLGVSSDSVYYIEGARNLKNHFQFITNNGHAITHWPPFYSILLALFSSVFSRDILSFGPLFNGLTCSLVFLIFNLILYKINASVLSRMFLNIFFILSPVLYVFRWYWSEGTFLLLVLLLILLLIIYHSTKKTGLLVFIGVIGGLTVLTRISGLSLIAIVSLYLLIFSNAAFRIRIINYVVFVFTFLTPILSWVFYLKNLGSSITDRQNSTHIISSWHFNMLFEVFLSWIGFSSILFMIFLFAFFITLLVFKKKCFRLGYFNLAGFQNNLFLLGLLAGFLVSYLLLLIVSISFFDAATPIDQRILSPIYPIFLLLFYLLMSFIEPIKNRPINIVLFFVLTFILSNFLKSSYIGWAAFSKKGYEYTGMSWKNSDLIYQYQANQLNNYKVYTNGLTALMFFFSNSKSEFYEVPKKFNLYSTKENNNYLKEMIALRESILKEPTAILYFNNSNRYDMPGAKEIKLFFRDFLIIDYKDGFVIKSH